MTPRTRGIIINSPGNPTGALIAEGGAARSSPSSRPAQNIWLVVDLCYEKLIYDPVPHNLPKMLAETCPRAGGDLRLGVEGVCDDRLALRLADRAGGGDRGVERDPEPLDVERHLDHAEGGGRGADRIAGAGHARCSTSTASAATSCTRWLTADPRLRCRKPAGAFYMFVDIGDTLSPDGFRTSLDFADALLEEQRVAVTPGEAFDAPGTIRISYATSMETARGGQPPAARVRREARAADAAAAKRTYGQRRPDVHCV